MTRCHGGIRASLPGVLLLLAGCASRGATTIPPAPEAYALLAGRTYAVTLDAATSVARDAARSLGWSLKKEDNEGETRTLLFVTGSTAKTLFSVVVVCLAAAGGRVRVDATSSSGARYDWGAGVDNLNGFYAAMDARLTPDQA